MDSKRKLTLITAGVAVIYTIVLIGWHIYTPADNFSLQTPGADNRPEGNARKADDVVVGEFFMKYDEKPQTRLMFLRIFRKCGLLIQEKVMPLLSFSRARCM